MKRETFINFFENDYKGGTYVKVVKLSTKGEFTKITEMITRFVNYYNTKGVKERGYCETKPREYEEQIIPHILKHNNNTDNDLLMCYPTNHHKAHTKFYYKGMEITEEEYYSQSGEKKRTYGETPLFMMKLDEIVSVGGIQ